jgi:hypothetical protein
MSDAEFMDFFANMQEAVEAVREDDGLIRVAWIAGERRDMKRTVWFNEERGFTPERYEFQGRTREVWKLRDVTTTEWQQQQGLWVPVRMTHQGLVTKKDTELAFTWESLNEPLPDELFTAEGFESDEGTYIVDARLGPPVITEIVGQEYSPPQPPDTPPRREWQWTPLRIVLASALALMFALAMLSLARRRWRGNG